MGVCYDRANCGDDLAFFTPTNIYARLSQRHTQRYSMFTYCHTITTSTTVDSKLIE